MTDDVLALCAGLPQRGFAAGTELLAEGKRTGQMLVLVEGCVEIRRGGTALATVAEPGAFLGEMAALLDVGHTASVVATAPTQVYVIEDATEAIRRSPELLLAVARLLAGRVNAMTTYLADLARQYGDDSGHLGLVHTVLGELTGVQPLKEEKGSQREVPDC